MKNRKSLVAISITAFVVIAIVLSVVIGLVIKGAIEKQLMNLAKESAHGVVQLTSGQLYIANTSIDFYKTEALDMAKSKIKAVVDSAYAAVEKLYNDAEKGIITQEQAQKMAKEYLGSIRYDGGVGYVFVVDTNYVMVVHISPSLIGKKLETLKDPNGVLIIKDLVDGAVKNGEIYVKYMWAKPGQPKDKLFPKLSYGRYFKPWGWIIGTGVYIDTIDAKAMAFKYSVYNVAAKTITSFKLLEAYPFVMDKEGHVIIHPIYENGIQLDPDKQLVAIDKKDGKTNLGRKAWSLMEKAGKSFVSFDYYYTKPGDKRVYKKIGFFYKVPETDLIAALSFYEDDLKKVALGAVYPTLGVFGIFTIFMILVVWYLLQFVILRRLKIVEDISEHLAQGNLVMNIDRAGNDEIGAIVEGLREAVDRLREMILSVRQSAVEIGKGASELEDITVQASDTLVKAVSSFEEVRRNISDATDSVVSVADSAMALQQSADEVANAATNLSAFASEIGQMAEEGKDSLMEVISMIENTVSMTEEAKNVVDELAAKSNGIGVIVKTISDIAEQTNLLALNAAIEAARAGEAGRGFAVVADEIRKLAENTQEAVGEIANILKGIQADTERVKESTEEIARSIEGVQQASIQSGDKFASIVEKIMDMNTQVESLAAISEEQSATTSEVRSAIEGVASTMRAVDKQVEVVASDIVNVQNIVMEIRDAVHKFGEIAEDMMKKVSQFKV